MADSKRTGGLPGFRLPPGLTLIDKDGRIDLTLIAEVDSLAERSINGGPHILFVAGRQPDSSPPWLEVYPGTGGRFVLHSPKNHRRPGRHPGSNGPPGPTLSAAAHGTAHHLVSRSHHGRSDHR